MRTSSLFGAFAALAVTAVSASDVLDLKSDTFASAVEAPLSLVEFFAPWCGHCKALAPHYEEAATILKAEGIPLAKVDCTEQADLCQTHGVTGYPTLKVFRKGESTDYSGPRKTDGIVSYMRKQSLPAISDVTTDNHADFSKADKIVIIAYLDADDTASKAAFTEYAELHRDDYLFGISTDSSSLAGVSAPSVVLYKTFDEGRNDLPGAPSADALNAFVKEHAVPLLDEISPENFALYAESGLPLAYIFIESTNKNRESVTKSIEPVAREHKGKVNFVWIDSTKFADHAKSLNLPEPIWPSFAIQNIAEMTKFPLPQTSTVDEATIRTFMNDYVAGKIAPSVKSQPIPKTQDEPVYVLVADEFEEVAADDGKDLLVEFYAPWCGHCKKLKPVWDSLGEKYANVAEKITIAKFDATENDIPVSAGFKVTGFPTIKFRAAGTSEWISYEGDRSLDSLVEFLEQNATNEIDIPDVAAPASPEGETVVVDGQPGSSAHDEL